MFNSLINRCFVISLPHDTKRRQHIRDHFSQREIHNFQFIEGVHHASDEVKEYYQKGLVKPLTDCFRCGKRTCQCKNNILIPQQVGNWLSFIKAWKKVAQLPGWTLICEDDVYFYQNSTKYLYECLVDRLPPLIDKPSIIRLGQSGQITDVIINDCLRLTEKVVMSNPAYIVNQQYAQLLLSKLFQINTTSDIWVHRDIPAQHQCHALTITPVIATELSFNKEFAKFRSQIHPKGIDPEDSKRAQVHIKKADTIKEYLDLLKKWSGNNRPSIETFQIAAFNELQHKQDILIKKSPPQQPHRTYNGQLDQALQNEYGFVASFEKRSSIDKHNAPIPWMTYSAINYIKSLDLSQKKVFEWGSGNSSLFFGSLAAQVTSIESNPDWATYAQHNSTANITTKLRTGKNYCSAIDEDKKLYDLIVIDGDIFRRQECAYVAIAHLISGGIIILDNADWLPNTATFLRGQGFTQIDFSGPGPINNYLWCTSIFFRGYIGLPIKKNHVPGSLETGLKNKRDFFIPVAANKGKACRLPQDYMAIKREYIPNFADIFTSQEGEDILVRRLLKWHYKNQGTFVDVGAHHPVRFSNTYHYYLRGWRGINIDPLPGSKKLFDEVRPADINLECGIANATTTMLYYRFKEPAFNTFDTKSVVYAQTRTELIDTVEVNVQPMRAVLDEFLNRQQNFYILNVDVEGLELQVLQSNNWNKYRPKLVIVEALTDGALEEITSYMDNQEYVRVASTKNSYFYCERTFWKEVM